MIGGNEVLGRDHGGPRPAGRNAREVEPGADERLVGSRVETAVSLGIGRDIARNVHVGQSGRTPDTEQHRENAFVRDRSTYPSCFFSSRLATASRGAIASD